MIFNFILIKNKPEKLRKVPEIELLNKKLAEKYGRSFPDKNLRRIMQFAE